MAIFRDLLNASQAPQPALAMRFARLVMTSCALVLGARVSVAQPSSGGARRLSTTIGLSKGAGALTCPFCTGDGKSGVAGLIGVETTYRPGIRVGLEADWWLHSGGGSSRSVMAIAPVAHLYASRTSALFIKLGVGIARFTASSEEEELRTTVVSGVVGGGYEFRLSNRTVLVPYVSWLGGNGGTMRLNGAQVTPLGGLSLLQYGLALSKR